MCFYFLHKTLTNQKQYSFFIAKITHFLKIDFLVYYGIHLQTTTTKSISFITQNPHYQNFFFFFILSYKTFTKKMFLFYPTKTFLTICCVSILSHNTLINNNKNMWFCFIPQKHLLTENCVSILSHKTLTNKKTVFKLITKICN